MKKIWYFAFMMICALLVTSCSKDDDEEVDETWREENRLAWIDITGDPNYTPIKSQSGAGDIYIRKIRNGDSTKKIYYNSEITIHYKGYFHNGKVFDDTHEPIYKPTITTTANTFVDGFTTALQWMTEGDSWEVWIPYQLAYGTAGFSSIPGYSNLRFEIEVVEILDKPK